MRKHTIVAGAVMAAGSDIAIALRAACGGGARTFRGLWAAVKPHEAETLAGTLARVAEALNVEPGPTGGTPSSLSEG